VLKFLPLILKNVFRKKTRALLTVASILLPLLAICLMGAFLAALDRPDPATTRGMFRLIVRHRVSLASILPASYLEKIRGLPGVVAATDSNWFGGKYGDGSARTIFARFFGDAPTLLGVYDDMEIVQGSKEDWLNDRAGALVGFKLAEKFGWKIGDKVVLLGDIFPVNPELTVRAIYRVPEGTSAAFFFHRAYIDESVPGFKGSIFMIWLRARDAEAAHRLTRQIDAMFDNSPYPTRTETEKEFQNAFVSMLGNVRLLLRSLGTIIVLVILLIASNTMALSARERVTEIAVMRTLGFTRRGILLLVLGEGLVLGVLGGASGVGLFVLLEPPLRQALMQTPMAAIMGGMRVDPGLLVGAFLTAVGTGLLAGLVPALTASRRAITDGLRQPG